MSAINSALGVKAEVTGDYPQVQRKKKLCSEMVK